MVSHKDQYWAHFFPFIYKWSKVSVPLWALFYAPDLALLVSHKDANVVEQTLSCELKKVRNWLGDNKLSLHLGKTESILFRIKASLKKSPELRVKIDGTVYSKNDIGCVLDNKQSMDRMAHKVLIKINNRIKFLARVSWFLGEQSMKMLSGALVQCHYHYACSSWFSSLPVVLKNKLQTSQNK